MNIPHASHGLVFRKCHLAVCLLAVMGCTLWWGGGDALAEEAFGGWAYRQRAVEMKVAPSGQIERWAVDGKTLIESLQATSPLALKDDSGREFLFKAESAKPAGDDSSGLRISGRIEDSLKKDSFPVSIAYQMQNEGRQIAVDIEPLKVPALTVCSYRWSLPLHLNPRKRVFYLSDYALPWDTRYFHQTMVDPVKQWKLVDFAEANTWRFFALDQFSPGAYRLWKSESERTAPLIMHEGKAPAPLVLVYDEGGGVALEYPQMRQMAPASIRVDAAGGAQLEVQFHPSSVPPITSSESGAFAGQHLILTALPSEAAALAWEKETPSRYAMVFSPPPEQKSLLREPSWVRNAPLDAAHPQYVTGGVPFARGTLSDAGQVRVKSAGEPLPLQSKPLAYWPDGSIKWAQLTFPLDLKMAAAESGAPRVTLRDERSLPVEIAQEKGAPSPVPASSLLVEKTESGLVNVTNGDLKVQIGMGENWMRRLLWKGKDVLGLGSGQKVQAYCEFLKDPKAIFPFDQKTQGGVRELGILKVDSLSIDESGPFRVVVRLEGLTSNHEATRIVMRLEFLAGRPEIRIVHTAVLRFKDPRRTAVSGLGLEVPFSRSSLVQADVAGKMLAGTSVAEVSLLQATPLQQTLWTDGTPANTDAPGSLRLSGPSGGITAVIRNFQQQAPKAIAVNFKEGKLRLELWPQLSSPMDMRRYSDVLHLGHLECGLPPNTPTWVNDRYYLDDPVYGISRTHEMLLAFDSPEAPAQQESLAADFQSPPLLYSGWERYQKTGVILPSSTQEQAPRTWAAWTNLVRFFLYHQELHCWKGFWEYGDFRHRFQGGFGWMVSPETLKSATKESVLSTRVRDSRAANDWCYDIGAYGWSNTEGLPNLFLQTEYLRHGNRKVYFTSEAMARRSRDVVIRQEGRWLGRGTRHGVQPWSDGSHEERQTTTTEYRLNYLLSGDGRSRDVIENLYQNIYTKGVVDYEPSHSGRLTGLLFHWELTGSPEEGERLGRYVSQFVGPEGLYSKMAVRFPEIRLEGERKMLNSGSQWLNTFGGLHSLIEYYQLTGDAPLKDALIQMADAIIQRPIIEDKTLGEGDYSWPAVAFAALHAPNPAPYQAFLRRYIEAGGWRNAYQMVAINPAHWSGPSAFMVKTVPLAMYWENWAPYVSLALPEGDVWTPAIEKEFNTFEEKGRPDAAVEYRPSWQSEFDKIPECDAFLAPSQPWRK